MTFAVSQTMRSALGFSAVVALVLASRPENAAADMRPIASTPGIFATFRVARPHLPWLGLVPRAPDFRVVSLPPVDAAHSNGPLSLTWRQHEAEPEGEGRRLFELAIERGLVGTGGPRVVVSLGQMSGVARAESASFCARRGYRYESSGVRSEPSMWNLGPLVAPFLVSRFVDGSAQGDGDFLVVADASDPGVLHLLENETSDGLCVAVAQGPFTTCEGLLWNEKAEIHTGPGARLEGEERIVTVDAEGEETTLPCEAVLDRSVNVESSGDAAEEASPDRVQLEGHALPSPWIDAIPRSAEFQMYTLPGGSASLDVDWQSLPQFALDDVPDWPELAEKEGAPDFVEHERPVGALVLQLSRDDETVSIPLGDHAGEVRPTGLSFCDRAAVIARPWPSEEAAPAETGVPATSTAGDEAIAGPRYSPPNAVAWFEQGTMQGSVQFLIVADVDVLHVLRLEDNDGSCKRTRQGPFDICAETPWERYAEVRMPIDRTRLDPPDRFTIRGTEGAHDVGYIGDRAPIDCSLLPFL